ncbi:hypothetical protein EQG64_34300 [Streptomyces sp. S6]|nr:hypothetical protein EQG64_34300 [Streptomyces sp. S6]
MSTGRARLACRVTVTAADLGELAEALAAAVEAELLTGDAGIEGPVPVAPSCRCRPTRSAGPALGGAHRCPQFLTAGGRTRRHPRRSARPLPGPHHGPGLVPPLFGDDAVAHRPGDPLPAVPGLAGVADLGRLDEPGALVTERIEAAGATVLSRYPRTGLRCLHFSGARRSALAGFYRALSGELSTVISRTVRVDGDVADLAAAVAAESTADDQETEIRYAGSRRRRRVVGFAQPGDFDPLAGLDRGAVLITGGRRRHRPAPRRAPGRRGARHRPDRRPRCLPVTVVSLVAEPATDPLMRAPHRPAGPRRTGREASVHTHELNDVATLRRLINRHRDRADG